MLRKIAIVALIGFCSVNAHAKKNLDQFLYDYKRSNYTRKLVKTDKYQALFYEHKKDKSDLRLSSITHFYLINSIEFEVNLDKSDFDFACSYSASVYDSLKMKLIIKKDIISDLDSLVLGDTQYKFSDLQNPPKFKNEFVSYIAEYANISTKEKGEVEGLINNALKKSFDKNEVIVDLGPDYIKSACFIAKNGFSLQTVISYEKTEGMLMSVINQDEFLKLYDAFWDLSEKRSKKPDNKFAQNVFAGIALYDENLQNLELYSGTRLTDLVEALSTQKRISPLETLGKEELEKRWMITKESRAPEGKKPMISMSVSAVKPNVKIKVIFKQ